MSTAAERSSAARIAAHTRWANEPDRTAATAAARAKSPTSYAYHLADMRRRFPHETEEQIAGRAENAHRAYMGRLSKRGRVA